MGFVVELPPVSAGITEDSKSPGTCSFAEMHTSYTSC